MNFSPMRALRIITVHVIYNPAYTSKFQLKTTIDPNHGGQLHDKQGKLNWGMSDDGVTVMPWLPFNKNKIEGTPILKLAMVKWL